MKDILTQVKELADINTVIRATEVGVFPNMVTTSVYRGSHSICGRGDHRSCLVNPRTNTWQCYACGQRGGVVEWVLGALYEGQQHNYQKAIRWLANYYAIPCSAQSDLSVTNQRTYAILTDLALQWANELQDNSTILMWVKDKWGITKETAETFGLGFCRNLIQEKYTDVELIQAGILDSQGGCNMVGRVTFPFYKNGMVQWLIGRLPYEAVGQPKYVCLNKTSVVEPVLYGFDAARKWQPNTDPLLLVEGPADAVVAMQNGFRAAAFGGTNMFTESIKSDFKEVVDSVNGSKFVVFDNDKNQAGLRGAHKLAETLLSLQCDPYLVQLPKEEHLSKLDLPDYMKLNKPEALTALLAAAVGSHISQASTYPMYLINQCPVFAEGAPLNRVLNVISYLDDNRVKVYCKALSDKTGLPAIGLEKQAKGMRKLQGTVKTTIEEEYEDLPWYSQDFRYEHESDIWACHTTVYLPVTAENEDGEQLLEVFPSHLVSSIDKEHNYSLASEVIYAPTDAQLTRLPDKETMIDKDIRWSLGVKTPWSYTNFVNGVTTRVDMVEIFESICALFDKFCWFPTPDDKYIAAMYPFITYIYQGFQVVPYLFLCGDRNSGKSTVADILGLCCFNALGAASLTGPAAYRTIHSTRPTIIIDEAEQLNSPAPNSGADMLLRICNAGYFVSTNSKVRLCENVKNKFATTHYECYSPKIFMSTQSLHTTLASRCITIYMRRPVAEDNAVFKEWTTEGIYHTEALREIRDKLRIWGLTQFRRIREKYDSIPQDFANQLKARDRQIWKIFLALSLVLDEHTGDNITDKFIQLAKDKATSLKAKETAVDFDAMVMATALRVLKDNPDVCGIYKKRTGETMVKLSVLLQRVREELMLQQVPPEVYNSVSPMKFIERLYRAEAIPSTARRSSARHNGRTVASYRFRIEKLASYVIASGWNDQPDQEDQIIDFDSTN